MNGSADYKGKLKPGDVLVHDSSIGIYDPIGGTPAILTAREGQPINGKKQYTDLLVSSGYEWKRDVLAVVRAKGGKKTGSISLDTLPVFLQSYAVSSSI